jgi:hypothetical protein
MTENIKKIITDDESRCCAYDLQREQETSRKIFAKTEELAIPNILHEDSAHHYWTQTVLFTSNYLQRAKPLMQCYYQHNGHEPHKAGSMQMKEWFLLHNNAPSRNCVTVT